MYKPVKKQYSSQKQAVFCLFDPSAAPCYTFRAMPDAIPAALAVLVSIATWSAPQPGM